MMNLNDFQANEFAPCAKGLPKTALTGQFCPAGGRCRAFGVLHTFFHHVAENFGKTKSYLFTENRVLVWHGTCVALLATAILIKQKENDEWKRS
jgi:hypothetical protein